MAGYANEPAMRGLMMTPEEQERDRQYDLQNPEMRRELEMEMARGGNSIQRAALSEFYNRMYGGNSEPYSDAQPSGSAPTQTGRTITWTNGATTHADGAPVQERTAAWAPDPKTIQWALPDNPNQNTGFVGDTVTDLKRGVAKLPGVVGGVLDTGIAAATGARPFARAGEYWADATGLHPEDWAEDQQRNYSPQRQASQANIDEVSRDPKTNGWDVLAAYATNPRAAIGGVAESVPGLLAGGAVTKGLQATAAGARAAGLLGETWAAPVMGGVGQGVVSAGGQMASVDPNAPDQERQAWAAMGRGATDATLMAVGGRAAHALGLETPATAMAGGRVLTPIAEGEAMDLLAAARPAAPTRLEALGATTGRLGGAAVSQAAQGYPLGYAGQVWSNVGAGKEDLTEGANTAGVSSAVGGAIMGPMFNLRGRATAREKYDTLAERSKAANSAGDEAFAGGQQEYADRQQALNDKIHADAAKIGPQIPDDIRASREAGAALDYMDAEGAKATATEESQYDQLHKALVARQEESLGDALDKEHAASLANALPYHQQESEAHATKAKEAADRVIAAEEAVLQANKALTFTKENRPKAKVLIAKAEKALADATAALEQAHRDESEAQQRSAHHDAMVETIKKFTPEVAEDTAPTGRKLYSAGEVQATKDELAKAQAELAKAQRQAQWMKPIAAERVHGDNIRKLSDSVAGLTKRLANMPVDTEGAKNASSKTVHPGDVQGEADGGITVGTAGANEGGGQPKQTTKNTGGGKEVADANGAKGGKENQGDKPVDPSVNPYAATVATTDTPRKAQHKPAMDKPAIGALARVLAGKEGGMAANADTVLGPLAAPLRTAVSAIHTLTKAREKLIDSLMSSSKSNGRTIAQEGDIHAELGKVTDELVAHLKAVEDLVGTNNVNKAQTLIKNDKPLSAEDIKSGKLGLQTSEGTRFSIVHNDWQNGRIDTGKALTATTSKVIRENNKLGEFTLTKLADIYTDGYKFGQGKYTGVSAVLMYLRHGGVRDPFTGRIASLLYERLKSMPADQHPTMSFWGSAEQGEYKGGASGGWKKNGPAPTELGRTTVTGDKAHIDIGAKGNNAEVILHEIFHGALANALHAAKNAAVGSVENIKYKAFEALRKEVVRLLKADKYAEVRAKMGDAAIADLANKDRGAHEFLSYGITNRDLRTAMEGMKSSTHADVKAGVPLYKVFIQKLRMLLGLSSDKDTLLTQYLHVSDYIMRSTPNAKAGEGGATGKFNAARGSRFDRLSQMWADVTQQGGKSMFRIGSDGSYGTPKRAYTLEQVLSHHIRGTEGWAVQPYSQTRLERTGDANLVRGWELTNNKGGSAHIFENKAGEVTFQSPSSTPGAEMWRGLQAALAYSFFNGKTFINEAEKFTMSDSAVARYTEAMQSAAIKFGSTDFMEPSRRQRDPQNVRETVTGEDKDGWISTKRGDQSTPEFRKQAEGLDLKGWWSADKKDTTVKERLEHNVGLMAKMTSGLEIAKNPELANIEYTATEDGLKFTRNGKVVAGLSTTEKRTVLNNFMAHASDEQFMTAKAGMAMEPQPELSGVFHSRAPGPGGMPVDHGIVIPSQAHNAPKKALLEGAFRALLPTLYGKDPKAMRAMEEWASRMADGLRKRDPGLAAYIGKVYADFNVSPAIAKLVQTFKQDRANPVTSANELGSWIKSVADKPTEITKAFAYMDAIEATSQKAAREKFTGQLPDHVLVKVEDAWRALKAAIEHESTTEETREQLEGLKPSEMLTRALQADNVQGQGLGAREEKIFAGKRVSMPESGIKDLGRPATSSDRFYPVYEKGPNGDMVLDQMVHASRAKEFPTAETSTPYVMAKFNAAESRKQGENVTDFRALSTVDSLLADKSLGKDAADTVATSFLNTVSIMANSVATRKLMRDVADVGGQQKVMFDDEAALRKHLNRNSPVHVEQMRDSNSSAILSNESRKPGNWVQFPTSEAFGDLAGKIVEGPVYARISDSLNRSALVDSQMYNGLIRTFKGMKTKYSPSTSATNIMGNFTLAHMNNLPLSAVKEGLALYLKYKVTPGKLSSDELAIMSSFHASGATLGDYSTNEVKKMMYEAMAAKSESSGVGFMNEFAGWSKYEGSLREKILEHAKRTGRRVDDIAGEAYATGDNMFRLAAFMTKMGELQKTRPEMSRAEMQTEAGAYAKHSFLDYDNDSRLLHALRQGPFPFISWTYAYTGVMAKIAKEQPWKMASLALAYSMVSGALSASETPDDKKERARAHKDDSTWFGANKSWNIGKHEGRNVYFDAAKWFAPTPLEFSDAPNGFMGFHSWPSALTPNNPILTSLMYMSGYDPYIGKPISKDTASDSERAIANISKVATQFTPPAVSERLLGPKPGVLGHPGDTAVHYTRLLAAPVSAVDSAESKKGLELEIKRVERGFDQEISNAKRNANLGKIPRADSQAAIKGLEARKAERIAALKKEL